MKQKYQKLRSRKLWFAIVINVEATVGMLLGKLDGPSWVAAITLVATVYIGANVLQKKIENRNEIN